MAKKNEAWECVNGDIDDEELTQATYKLKVEGGWLYLHWTFVKNCYVSESMCFVPEE